jgi:hypothetical protein
MQSSGILRHAALVRTDVSEEFSASIIRVTIIGKLGTMKCQFLQEPHAITSQKMAFFIVTAVKTSNLTKASHILREKPSTIIFKYSPTPIKDSHSNDTEESSSVMRRHVVRTEPDVFEEHFASIFWVKKQAKQETSRSKHQAAWP